VLKRLIGKTKRWLGIRCEKPSELHIDEDPRLDREIASSLTDETLAWALGTWSKRYL